MLKLALSLAAVAAVSSALPTPDRPQYQPQPYQPQPYQPQPYQPRPYQPVRILTVHKVDLDIDPFTSISIGVYDLDHNFPENNLLF